MNWQWTVVKWYFNLLVMKKIYIFIVLILTASFILTGCSKNPKTQSVQTPGGEQLELPANPELEKNYEKQLSTLFKTFWQTQDETGLRDQVLELRAPAKYLDLHLNIVLALDMIEQARISGIQSQVDEGVSRLNSLSSQYSWFK